MYIVYITDVYLRNVHRPFNSMIIEELSKHPPAFFTNKTTRKMMYNVHYTLVIPNFWTKLYYKREWKYIKGETYI